MNGCLRSAVFATPHALSIALGLLAFSQPAAGNINLELRPTPQSVFVGNTVSVGLYAVSDTPVAQTLSTVEVIVNWNTAFLSLVGDNNAGSPMTGFTPGFGADPYGFNTSLADGDAIWVGGAPFGSPVSATAAGTYLTTFNFTAPNTGGITYSTTVIHGSIPGFNIVGSLSGATITINVPAPGAMLALLGGLVFGRPRRRR
jgi:hypothetical protein